MATSPSGRYRDALRQRDFRLLVLSAAVDGIGSWIYSVVLAVVVFDQTHSALWLSVTAAARWIPSLLLSSYAGVLADRYERTRVMLASALADGVIMCGLTAAIALHASVWILLAGSAAAAIAESPYAPAAGALTPQVVQEKDLTAANSLMATLDALVVVVGPAVGGALLLTGRPAIGIGVNAASFFLAALVVVRLRTSSRGEAAAGEPFVQVWLEGLRALGAQRLALTLVIFCGVDSAIYGASTVLYAPLSVRLHTGTNGYGYLLAANALGAAAAAGFANRLAKRQRLALVIVGSIVLQAAPFALTAATRTPAVAAALQVVSGVGMVIVDVLAITALQRDLPSGVLSRVLGVFGAVVTATTLVGSFLVSGLLSSIGLVPVLLIVGTGFSMLGIAGLPVLLRGDDVLAAAAAAVDDRVELLAKLDLFTGASRGVLEQLARGATESARAADDVLIRQGDEADALWILVTGSLTVRATAKAGKSKALPDIAAPAYVGEIGLVRHVPRTATVTTREACRVLRIESADFLAAVESAPPSTTFMQVTGARWARTNGSKVSSSRQTTHGSRR